MKHGKYGILNWFIRQALEGKPLTIYGDHRQARDYIYNDDIVRGMLLGAMSKIPYDVFNIGSGTGTAFGDMARLIAEHVGGVEVVPGPGPRKDISWRRAITWATSPRSGRLYLGSRRCP